MSTPPKRTPEKLRLLAETTLGTAAELARCKAQNIPHSNQSRTLDKNLLVLKQGVAELERELSAAEVSGTLPSSELERKETIFFELTKKIEKIESLAQKGELPSDRERLFDTARGAPGPSKFVRFAALAEDNVENEQILQLQQRVLDDQDRNLEQLSSSLGRQREMGLMMTDELDGHAELLDSIERGVDRTESNLSRAQRRLNTFSKKAKENGTCFSFSAELNSPQGMLISLRFSLLDKLWHPTGSLCIIITLTLILIFVIVV